MRGCKYCTHGTCMSITCTLNNSSSLCTFAIYLSHYFVEKAVFDQITVHVTSGSVPQEYIALPVHWSDKHFKIQFWQITPSSLCINSRLFSPSPAPAQRPPCSASQWSGSSPLPSPCPYSPSAGWSSPPAEHSARSYSQKCQTVIWCSIEKRDSCDTYDIVVKIRVLK